MPKMFKAAPRQDKVRPAFTVQKLEGTYEKRVYRKTEQGLEYDMVSFPKGYLVTFLKGHSIHVATEAELKRLELNNVVPMFDTSDEDSDEEVGLQPVVITSHKPASAAANRSQ